MQRRQHCVQCVFMRQLGQSDVWRCFLHGLDRGPSAEPCDELLRDDLGNRPAAMQIFAVAAGRMLPKDAEAFADRLQLPHGAAGVLSRET